MNNFILSILNIIFTPYDILTNTRILKYYATVLLIMSLMYILVMVIYCYLFNIKYLKFIKATIFPIIGMIILIIQGIIYIFFIPYYIFIVIKDTFAHTFQVISVFINWIYNFIDTTLNIEDYLLNG